MSIVRDEVEWRALATQIMLVLNTILGDRAPKVAADIDRALAQPPGPTAKRELRRVLTGLPELRAWLREWAAREEEGYRAAPPPERHLEVSVAETVAVGQRVPLFVRVALQGAGGATALKPIDVPPEGAQVTVSIWAPTMIVAGDMEYELTVPAARDSEPVRFSLTAPAAGVHRVRVLLYRGGTFLGEAEVRLTADVEVRWPEEAVRGAVIGSMAVEPGEVTLQVVRDLEGYRFQFLGDALHPPVRLERLAGDPRAIVEEMTAELGRMAAGEATADSPALVRRRLQGMGAKLWDVVPEKIREQYWAQADRIASFTIASELDSVPWELLYPVDGLQEDGFLVGRVPVARRVYGQRRVRRLAVPGVVYVRPPAAGPDGGDAGEIAALRARFTGIEDGGVLEDLDDLHALTERDVAGIVHFAGHHAFTPGGGGAIRLNGGELRPDDLELAARRTPWKKNPLVFLNGCRTAGEVPAIATNTGWADTFLRIGAGAFIGSLWGVRSESAARFAESFYAHFLQHGLPLGQATLRARREIMDEAGDPTWLAYSVYGSPATAAAGR
ncbi:CHAT domain-containing protein [Actinomadura terrae]|uniref:CHAT domain-containing protein n=1 Tax=Actinomadura terrae TaxID=604353 RepID=UPI001FA80FCF|nr:CHAT domain-containing protein [Actinomadura terrae]